MRNALAHYVDLRRGQVCQGGGNDRTYSRMRMIQREHLRDYLLPQQSPVDTREAPTRIADKEQATLGVTATRKRLPKVMWRVILEFL